MLYTVINNFVETDSYEGIPSSDERGNFILFPLELSDIMVPNVFLKTPDGSVIQIKEDDYHRENAKISKLKVYY